MKIKGKCGDFWKAEGKIVKGQIYLECQEYYLRTDKNIAQEECLRLCEKCRKGKRYADKRLNQE